MSIQLVQEGRIARLGDLLMRPIMYIVSGTCWEAPQESHAWNWRRIKRTDAESLSKPMMVVSPGRIGECHRHDRMFPRFYLPICGGWRRYVVLEPVTHTQHWYVGWITSDHVGISQLPIQEKVRVLEGPQTTRWFGLDRNSTQIVIWECGRGQIGEGGPFAKTPLR